MKARFYILGCALAAGGAATVAAAATPTQGVSASEVVLGTIQDMSGPAASYGKELASGMRMRIDEANEQGGINGRKIRFLVEDNGYDNKRAVLAAQKLVNQDKVFAILGHFGSSPNFAAMPVLVQKNVFNLMPMATARELYDPPHMLKYGFVTAHYNTIKATAPMLFKKQGSKKACSIYQDDDFGLEIANGAEEGLKIIGVPVERFSYKRGATDFSTQAARVKAAGCDFVVLGTLIRETVGSMSEVRKLGMNPTFLASAAAYSQVVSKLGGEQVEGLYAPAFGLYPYLDDPSPTISLWAQKYQTKFSQEPSVFSVYGYVIADRTLKALRQTGKDLTVDGFAKVMANFSAPDDFLMPGVKYTATDRQGTTATQLSRIDGGRWKVVAK